MGFFILQQKESPLKVSVSFKYEISGTKLLFSQKNMF